MGFLTGKRALIVGLASDRSIAHGIAAAMHREGAELAFTYQNDRLKDRVLEMAQAFNSAITLPMDVASDAEIDTAFAAIRAAKACPGRPQRFASAVAASRRLPCDARSCGPVA